MITQEMLNQRISCSATKYLLIFPNEQIKQFYKRWLQRNDIIYITEREIENNGLVGMRYINWNYVDETMTKHLINERFKKIEKEN